jgi:hypothetical protein
MLTSNAVVKEATRVLELVLFSHKVNFWERKIRPDLVVRWSALLRVSGVSWRAPLEATEADGKTVRLVLAGEGSKEGKEREVKPLVVLAGGEMVREREGEGRRKKRRKRTGGKQKLDLTMTMTMRERDRVEVFLECENV